MRQPPPLAKLLSKKKEKKKKVKINHVVFLQDFYLEVSSLGMMLFFSALFFPFAVFVRVGGFGLLGELWSSILSGCLEQAASIDNVKGCEGGGW